MNKPFDLKLAQQGAKIVTRKGKPVKLIGYFPELRFPVVAIIEGNSSVSSYSTGGMHTSGDMWPTDDDLFIHVETRRMYVNLYRSGRWFQFFDAESATKEAAADALAVALPVDIEGVL